MRFQQLTGPAMAKGLEDTAFYNYNRLISLNEVGGDPGSFGRSVDNFHKHNSFTAAHRPNTLLATATHDTKRGEDARVRINVLSEFPTGWREALQRWAKLNTDKKTIVRGELAPSANDEYLFYQTLIGVWPPQGQYSVFGIHYSEPPLEALRERVLAYMIKAIKEAKARTSWIEPNEAYEKAAHGFVSAALDEQQSPEFLGDFAAFQKQIAFFGYLNSVSQLVLKMTSPGVPDLYQGCELWDLSVVDPDNRRPVDFALRRRTLERLKSETEQMLVQNLLRKPESGAIKMFVLWRALQFRQAHRELFQNGDYELLDTTGSKAEHVVAFARRRRNQCVITVVPRLIAGLCQKKTILPLGKTIWQDTALILDRKTIGSRFRNIITHETLETAPQLPIGEIFANSPVAILEQVSP